MDNDNKFIRYCGAFTAALLVLLVIGIVLALFMWAFVSIVEQIF